jgi:tetratricopeptide (TPR) repeat protein
MRGFNDGKRFLTQCRWRLQHPRLWYMLSLSFFVSPAITSAQINHIEAAAQLLSQGQMDQAETEARQALADPTSHALALAMLGTIRLQQGKYLASTRFLNQALTLNPHLVGARTSLASAYQLQGKPDLARRNFQEALKLDANNFNARFGLAKVEASLHNYQQSLDLVSSIIPQVAGSEDGILLLATDYGALGRKDELRSLVRNWHSWPSPSEGSSLELANILAMSGMTDEAREILEAAETGASTHPSAELALALGGSYLSLGVLDRAEQNFQLALTANPGCVACYLGLAEIAERQENAEKALSYLVTAKRQSPDDPEVLFEFGKVCLQRNLLDDAVPALTKAVALKPDREQYVYVLASANVAKGDLSKASSLFAGLLKKRPQDPVLKYASGAVYYLQGKYPEAESLLKQSLQAQPDQVAAAYYLGLTYDAVGRDGEAVGVFRELLKSHPDHGPSCVKLGAILLRQHEYDEAQQQLEHAVSLDPGSVEAHYQLGLVLRRLGKTAESENQLAESRRLESERRVQTDVRLRLLLPD